MEEVVKKGISTKIVILVVISVAIVGGVLGIFLLNKGENKEVEKGPSNNNTNGSVENNGGQKYSVNLLSDEYFDETNPIPVKKNGKYGYVSSEGKEIVDFIYDNVWRFIGKYGVVSNNYSNKIIDRTGKIIYSAEDHKIDFSNAKYGNYVIDEALYDLNLEKVSEDNLKITSAVEGGYFTFSKDGKYGIINSAREVIFESDMPLSLEVNIGYNNVYGIIKESDYVRDVHKYSIIDMLTGNKIYSAPDNEIIEKKDICLFTVKTTSNNYNKVIVVKDGKLVAEINDSNFKDVYWRAVNFSELTLSYNDGTYKAYNIVERKLNNDISAYYPSSISEMKNVELSGYNLLPKDTTMGIETSTKEEIIPKGKFVNLMSSTVDSHNYILNKYNKIFVVASNLDNAAFYELKSKQVVFQEDSVRGIYMPQDTLFACTRTTYVLTFSPTLMDVKTIFNLFTGEKITFEEPVDVMFYTTYYRIEKDNKFSYYNSKFKKIYEVPKS